MTPLGGGTCVFAFLKAVTLQDVGSHPRAPVPPYGSQYLVLIFGHMHWVLRLLVPLVVVFTTDANAQVNGKKKLITTLGYGFAWPSFVSDSLSSSPSGNALDFSFDYGIARRWAIGLHYQRIGAHKVFGQYLSVRATTYEVMVTYALIARERSALNAMLGLGPGLTSFTVKGDRLSAETQAGAFSFGVRYWRCLSTSVGAFGTLWFTSVGSGDLSYADQSLLKENGSALTVAWRGAQLTFGAVVRF